MYWKAGQHRANIKPPWRDLLCWCRIYFHSRPWERNRGPVYRFTQSQHWTSENVKRVSLYLKPFLLLFYQRAFFSSLSLSPSLCAFLSFALFLVTSPAFPHLPYPLALMKALKSEMVAKRRRHARETIASVLRETYFTNIHNMYMSLSVYNCAIIVITTNTI